MIDKNLIKKEINHYFEEIKNIYRNGDYTEWTYRTPFDNFIKNINKNYQLIQEPKRTTGLGAPDFKAYNDNRKIGFIETKDLNANLDEILETEQLKKYIDAIDNLILTNYLQFILIRNKKPVLNIDLFTLNDLNKSKNSISNEKVEQFAQLISNFFDYQLPTISTAEELAMQLSKKAILLKDSAIEQLTEDINNFKNGNPTSSIYDFYQGIKELINDIDIEDCADAYAQTVTYGLFMAKKSYKTTLNRSSAASYIPKSVGIIKRIFTNISGDEFPSNIAWIVDDILDILNVADLDKILSNIDERGKKDKEPIIYFYEDFLNYYEPQRRKQLGVYYTPRPVVNFIVNSVHIILKEYFDKQLGLADDSVNVLDPAAGTGTFFWIAYLVVLNELKKQGLSGMIEDKIKNHLLKHFYGFELLITPYVISHLNLTDLLKKWKYDLLDNERIQIYLTNTLERAKLPNEIPFFREVTEENKAANKVKFDEKILAIIGNPPYAGISANKGKWIDDLLKKGYTRADGSKDDGYYKVDGRPLGEKNPKWLQDDYVKFIRFAQWKIDQYGEGVIGFITNHSFLDNPTFSGMRQSLLESFDRIYLLNLHGSSRRGSYDDENVFDIQQGVAISIFIKTKKSNDKKVFYADLWGIREDKYKWLDSHTIKNVEWQEINPVSSNYFFVPKNTSLEEKYNKFWKITDIFSLYSTGIVTAKDDFIIDFNKDALHKRIAKLRDKSISDVDIRNSYKLKDTHGWKLSKARKKLIDDAKWDQYFTKLYYRPFDIRELYYNPIMLEGARYDVMQHLLMDNIAIVTVRQVKYGNSWQHCLIADKLVESSFISNKTSEICYVFPLYLYNKTIPQKSNLKTMMVFEKHADYASKKPNFSPEFLKFITEKYGKTLTPEEIFYYIYAVLHSPSYREKYVDFLQYDFPRIPFVDDYEIFQKLSEIGKSLTELHLMKCNLPTRVKFDIPGSGIVEKVKYENGKIWVNDVQYFDGIPENIWNFYIGGYQVLDKWLKSRAKLKLDSESIMQFLQIIEVIRETIRLMDDVDKIVNLLN